MADSLRDFLSSPTSVAGGAKTESPIEAMFHRAFLMLACMERVGSGKDMNIFVSAQEQVGPYRCDFALKRHDRTVLVECDGHDFHERTKEQAARDRSRDRNLVADGFIVLRFTGSEIWANPFACAQQALDVLMDRATPYA